MKKILFIFIFLATLTSLNHPKPVKADLGRREIFAEQIVAERLDPKAEILTAYLASHNSPLQYSAQDFIDAARLYNLDWKMLPAIAGVESTFGKFIPGGYNAYGWGAYDPYHAIYFDSWKEGIYTVAKGLKEGYLDKGLLDPYSINKVYAASPSWGNSVTYFMNDLEKFAQNYKGGRHLLSEISIEKLSKIAAVSGQIASAN